MLLHLPIAILATLSPTAVSDTVPKFDIAKECRYEGGYPSDIDRCSRDEATALKQLKNEWGFVGTDRSSCMAEATIGGLSSYVELLTCLEIASDVRNEDYHPIALGSAGEEDRNEISETSQRSPAGASPVRSKP
jgi:hypothetical protein